MIVGGIIAVAVGVIIAVSLQQSAEIEFCDNWSEDLETQRQQLNTRANTLGGQLDLSGDLEADTIAFNQDVHRYNEECAN